MNTAARGLVAALTTVVLLLALATTECVRCGVQVMVSPGSAPCCNHDGHCKRSGNTRPCLATLAQTPALVQQTLNVLPAQACIALETAKLDGSQYHPSELPPFTQYSLASLYVLHSALLI